MNTQKRRDYRALIADDDPRLVERQSPGAAPTAFRIWGAGPNATDHGPVIFSQRSADLILGEQAARRNLYSIDLDHLSLETNRPAEAGRAAGWHKLAVRPDDSGAPALWAVDVEWCPDIREGLDMQPPKWRYFSPAYLTDKATGEVVSYTNTALCINPATWANPQLATTRKDTRMNEKQMLAALKAMMSGDGEKATKAAEMFSAMGGEERLAELGDDDEGNENGKDAEGDDDKPPPSSKKPQGDTRQRTATVPAKTTAREQQQDATLNMAVRLAKLEAAEQRREVATLIEGHKDRFTPATREWALGESIEVVQRYLKKAPKLDLRAPTTEQATRGKEQGTGDESGLPADKKTEIDARMGLGGHKDAIRREGTKVVFGAMTADEARKRTKGAA